MTRWNDLIKAVNKQYGIEADTNAILYLIGVQELGRGFEKFNKQEKTDLIDMAKAKLLSKLGLYTEQGRDEGGWIIFAKAENYNELYAESKNAPIEELVIEYFEEQGFDF